MRYQYSSLVLLSALVGCEASVPESTDESALAVASGPNAGQYRIAPSYVATQCLETVGANSGAGGTVDTWNCSTSGDPNWVVAPISSGVYEIRQPASGNCLTANGGTFANGNSLVLWGCYGQTGSRWNIVPSGPYYALHSVDNPAKCIDVNAWGQTSGTKVQVWDCSGGSNQEFAFDTSVAAALSVSSVSSSQYVAKLTVTNSTSATASNWQVALNMNQSKIDQVPWYGGTVGVTNGSVYFNNGLAVVTPANGATLAPGGSVQVTFIGDKLGASYAPSIASVDGIAGSFAPWNDGIDDVARAVATTALTVMTAWESTRTTNDLNDFAILDAHCYTLSPDGSRIVFDPNTPAGWYANEAANSALLQAQLDPSVASYLVSGLLSCFADSSGLDTYSMNAAALRGWSYTTTAQNVTLGTTIGTNNINRVGASVSGTERVTLTETVNPFSEDMNFGLVSTLPYSDFDTHWGDSVYAKFHGGNSVPCSPFNGPGGTTNPDLVISLNGSQVGARQQVPVTDCPYANHCVSTAVIDPIPYTQPGNYYDSSGQIVGPQSNPYSLIVTDLYADANHANQWATRTVNGVQQWGTFSNPVSVLGVTVYGYVRQY